jgi:hypothetical protein
MNKTLSLLKLLIGWPLSIIAIFFVIKLFAPKISEILPKIHSVNVLLLLSSVILFIIYFLLRSFVWGKIIEYRGHRMPFKKTAYLWGFSEFKRYVPGNIWSFLSRVSLFSDAGADKKAVGLALLDEIQLIIISCSIISVFSFPLIFAQNGSEQLLRQMALLTTGCIAVIIAYSVAVAYLFMKKSNSSFVSSLFLPHFTISQKLSLLLMSVLTFSVFGLATLTASLSIFSFDPGFFIGLLAFFTFALLAGYLSFITPTGLGVREGIITLGLSPLIGIANSGFLSIFTRIVLVFSEVIFLLIILAFDLRSKKK